MKAQVRNIANQNTLRRLLLDAMMDHLCGTRCHKDRRPIAVPVNPTNTANLSVLGTKPCTSTSKG